MVFAIGNTLCVNEVCNQLLKKSHNRTLKIEQIYEALVNIGEEGNERLLFDVIKFLETENIYILEDEDEIDGMQLTNGVESDNKKQDILEESFSESGDYDFHVFDFDDFEKDHLQDKTSNEDYYKEN